MGVKEEGKLPEYYKKITNYKLKSKLKKGLKSRTHQNELKCIVFREKNKLISFWAKYQHIETLEEWIESGNVLFISIYLHTRLNLYLII